MDSTLGNFSRKGIVSWGCPQGGGGCFYAQNYSVLAWNKGLGPTVNQMTRALRRVTKRCERMGLKTEVVIVTRDDKALTRPPLMGKRLVRKDVLKLLGPK